MLLKDMTAKQKEEKMQSMLSVYLKHAYTHDYIFGFEYDGKIYAVNITGLIDGLTLSMDSDGVHIAIRWKPTKTTKKSLIERGARVVDTTEHFETLFTTTKYNRGEIFEQIVTEESGLTWEKDRIPFDKGADIETAAGKWSVKFQAATLCSDAYLEKLG